MAKKEKMVKLCEYCGSEFETHQSLARFCRTSHRVYAFNKARFEKLKRLEAALLEQKAD